MQFCTEYGWDESFLPENFNHSDYWNESNSSADLNPQIVSAETIFGAYTMKETFTAEPLCAAFTKDFYSDFFAVDNTLTNVMNVLDECKQECSSPFVEAGLELHSAEGPASETSHTAQHDAASSASTPVHASAQDTDSAKRKYDEDVIGHQGSMITVDVKNETQHVSVVKKRSARQMEQMSQASKRLRIDEFDSLITSDIALSPLSCSTPPAVGLFTKRQRQSTPPLPQLKRLPYERRKEAPDTDQFKASTVPGSAAVLQECKFVSKRTGIRCACPPFMTVHKRGHLSVSCNNGHQWVWCSECCKCGNDTDGPCKRRGCSNKTHWFERDAFDTGRRNHMRTAHGVEESSTAALAAPCGRFGSNRN